MREKKLALTQPKSDSPTPSSASSSNAAVPAVAPAASSLQTARPVVPGDIEEIFLTCDKIAAKDSKLIYVPALYARASVHFVRAAAGIDAWQDIHAISIQAKNMSKDVWEKANLLATKSVDYSSDPESDFEFRDMPIEMTASRNYKAWQKELQEWIFKTYKATLYYAPALDKYSRVGQSESDARIDLFQIARELRDEKVSQLQQTFDTKLRALRMKRDDALAKLTAEEQEAQGHFWESAVHVGTSVLGALLGKKKLSQTNITRVSTAAKKITKSSGTNVELLRARERFEELQEEYNQLERECEMEVGKLNREFQVESLTLETVEIPCRKGDMQLDHVSLLWVPQQLTSNGKLTPLSSILDSQNLSKQA